MEFICPNCKSPVYSRKQKICGVCEKPLPKEFSFSDKQKDFLDKQEKQIEKQAKEFNLPDISYGSDVGGSGF